MQFAEQGRTETTTIAVIVPRPRRRSRAMRRSQQNVGQAERIASTLGGAALIVGALRARSFTGLLGGILGAELIRRGVTGHCMLYDQVGVDTSGQEKDKAEQFFRRGIHVEESVTIQRPREEIFNFWRNFENLPRFMDHLKSVEVIDEKTSRWVAKAPAGYSVEWIAEIINEEAGSLIAWRSMLGADVDNRGAVRFRDAPQGRGTEVKVTLEYIPPAGRLGAAVAGLFGESPEWQIRDDLRRLRQILETGEVATVEGQPSGRAMRERQRGEEWTRPVGMSDIRHEQHARPGEEVHPEAAMGREEGQGGEGGEQREGGLGPTTVRPGEEQERQQRPETLP